jgi:hypothetical protein
VDDPTAGIQYSPSGFVATGYRQIRPNPSTTILRARTTALDSLALEFRRYLEDQVRGRSCLIAGPRGSGKTTLIDTAHAAVSVASNECRLIRVRLHGPSLLQKPVDPTPASDTDGKSSKGDDETRRNAAQQALYEQVLRIVLINLYQTLAEEVANAYQERVAHRGPEALEMAAQLRLTLDGAPSTDVLRGFWESAGAVQSGVLGRANAPADQGVREIVALATASDAYRSCTGKFTREKTGENTSGAKNESEAKLGATGAELKQALVSASSGLGIGAAAAQYAGVPPLSATLIGAAAALLSTAAFSRSSTRTRETKAREAVTFLPDLTVASLVHRAPLVLRRLRQAGVAPVFIVDELDKLTTLSSSLTDLASYLKFISADEAFFCFLTDRSYLAEMAKTYNQRTDAVQRTIFTNRLFVNYHPRDLHAFLEQVIQPANVTNPYEQDELEADAQTLRYVLIQRSRMLPFELVRAIAEIRRGDRMVLPKDGRLDRAYQFHLIMQLALEVVLATPFVAERIARDAEFGQTIYDALYYPTYQWYKGARDIDISVDALMAGLAEASGHALNAADDDKNFLCERVERMLDLVCEPDRLKAAVKAAVDDDRISTLPLVREAILSEPRLLVRTSPNHYRWVYNPYGIPYEAADVNDTVDSPILSAARTALRKLPDTFRTLRLRPRPDDVLEATRSAVAILRRVGAIPVRLS